MDKRRTLFLLFPLLGPGRSLSEQAWWIEERASWLSGKKERGLEHAHTALTKLSLEALSSFLAPSWQEREAGSSLTFEPTALLLGRRKREEGRERRRKRLKRNFMFPHQDCQRERHTTLFSSSQEEEEPREGTPPQHSTTCPSTRSKPDRYRLPSFRLWNGLTLKGFPV